MKSKNNNLDNNFNINDNNKKKLLNYLKDLFHN